MKRNYRKAFDALTKMGAPVIEGGDNGEDTFWISAEDNVSYTWADYYQMTDGDDTGYMMGVSDKINNVLDANGLYAEWINAGVLGVHEN